MAIPKLEELSVSVAREPSLMTGAVPTEEWMDNPVVFKEGNFCYPAKQEKVEYLGFPNARVWSPDEDDWKLPDGWEEIITDGPGGMGQIQEESVWKEQEIRNFLIQEE